MRQYEYIVYFKSGGAITVKTNGIRYATILAQAERIHNAMCIDVLKVVEV